ncbi:gag-pol polyprotein [Hordeum vulgare]|nr:gag-pol polyprotein [Hordeum vulgare]
MDHYLKLLQVPSEDQVKCATRNFHDYASTWWFHTSSKSFDMSWPKTKKVMQQEFVPYTYTEHLQCLLESTIQGSRSLDEYFMEMKKALRLAGMDVSIWMKFHFMMGLNNDIAKTIFIDNYESLKELYIGALKAEKNSRPSLLDPEHTLQRPSCKATSMRMVSDVVPSSAFIHRDGEEMVEHGIFTLTMMVLGDELSDLCHHIEIESAFSTSPIYDVLPQLPCEESQNPHHLSEMSEPTICPIYDDTPILDNSVLPLEKTMAMVEFYAPTWFHNDEDNHDLVFATSPTPHEWNEKGNIGEGFLVRIL